MKKITSLHELEKITGGDTPALKELLSVFINEGSVQIQKMQNYLSDGNLPELSNTAHKIKSSLLLVGMDVYKPLAEKIERSTEAKTNTADVLKLIKIYTKALEELKTELKTLT